jgi:hypothetical protein
MVGHIFDRSVGNLKPTIIFVWPKLKFPRGVVKEGSEGSEGSEGVKIFL